MNEDFRTAVIAAYGATFGQPSKTLRRALSAPADEEIRVLAYLPDEEDQQDPDGNITRVCTAGFSSQPIFSDVPFEAMVEVMGPLDDASIDALADALAELGSSPLSTGRLLANLQVLTDLTLPAFRRFNAAMLIDWDATYEFRLPIKDKDIRLLRVIPVFPAEAAFVEASNDRRMAYLTLVNRGMNGIDPDRDPVNLGTLG